MSSENLLEDHGWLMFSDEEDERTEDTDVHDE